jgi:hypothetical protein|tara:strand:- start:105 stop:779 length:675 start_codon:yes stop_codon:yes gene_type:complete
MPKKLDTTSRVIIIGNSPSILLQEYGELIDSCDIVIRINKCATKGFEKHTGSKIDIWATTHHKYYPNFIPEGYENIKKIWKRTPGVKLKVPADFPEVKDWMMYKDKKYKFGHLTKALSHEPCTGLLTILTSTLKYEDITIVGFTFYTEEKHPTAYYRESELDEDGNHPEDKYWNIAEKSGFASDKNGLIKINIVKKLVEDGKIKLLNPTELYTVEELEKIEIDG